MSEDLQQSDRRPSIVADWWADLQDMKEGHPNPRADRASRARLRRADPAAAMIEESVLTLYRRLDPGAAGFSEKRVRLAVRLALVLAHVRDDETDRENGQPKRFSRRLGRGSFGDKIEEAVLKPIRFQRLLAARDEDDIIREFRRAVDLAGNTANVRDLARLLINWEREETRTRFAFDYFAAGSPEADAETSA